jgi:hypothetical protein
MRGEHFGDVENIKCETPRLLKNLTSQHMQHCFLQRKKRWTKCIHSGGRVLWGWPSAHSGIIEIRFLVSSVHEHFVHTLYVLPGWNCVNKVVTPPIKNYEYSFMTQKEVGWRILQYILKARWDQGTRLNECVTSDQAWLPTPWSEQKQENKFYKLDIFIDLVNVLWIELVSAFRPSTKVAILINLYDMQPKYFALQLCKYWPYKRHKMMEGTCKTHETIKNA